MHVPGGKIDWEDPFFTPYSLCYLFSTHQEGMILSEKTDPGLDVRIEEKQENTIVLH